MSNYNKLAIGLAVLALSLIAAADWADQPDSDKPASDKPAYLKNYHPVFGRDCIESKYVFRFVFIKSRKRCAAVCSLFKTCQAFTTMGGHCRLFLFDKCSKNVRKCSCNRVAKLYVRRQPGLRPGTLCPADFHHDRCGVKYKFVRPSSGRWDSALASCNAERGLTIMAEPIDRAKWFRRRRNRNLVFFLGGRQDPGSKEPAGGWFWHNCRIPIDPNLWQKGQPDNGGKIENYACRWSGFPLLNDCPMSVKTFENGAFCECLSPFDIEK
uniref:C-type lectin domain-containing protein n=1 Tax=Macrostomum lignano TaxID=282301 RepID=A0A1I8H311_9PLAT